MQVSLENEQKRAEELLLESQKAQERVAIRSLISVHQSTLHSRSQQVQTTLTNRAEAMKDFASQTLSTDLEGGFKGKTADAAKDFLKGLPQPNLDSPLK